MKILYSKTIRFLSSKFKINLDYFFRNGFWLLVGQVVEYIASIGLILVLTNALTPEAYGQYKYVITFIGIISVIGLNGYSTSIVTASAKGYDGVFTKSIKKILIYSLPASFAAILIGAYYMYAGNMTLGIGILCIGLTNPIYSSLMNYSSFLTGKKDFKQGIRLAGVTDIAVTGAVILCIFYTKAVLPIVLTYIFVHTATIIYAYKKTITTYTLNTVDDSESHSYAKHNSFIGIFTTLVFNIDKILVFHYLGAVELAIYSLVTQIPDQIKGVSKHIPTLLMANYANKGLVKDKYVWMKYAYIIATIGFMILCYIFLSKYIFTIFFPQYVQYVVYSQIYAVSLLSAATVFPMTIIQANQQKKELYDLNISTSVFQLFAVFIGVYYFGFLGAIVSRLVSRLFLLAVSTYLFIRIEHKKI